MSGEAVLVIDDSPTILKVVQMVLTKAGFQVTTAGDGDEGVEAAKRNKPDVILLDFVMPKMNGYQFCQALHQEEGLRDVPVILMSAKGDQVGERFIKAMGIVDYITKPFSRGRGDAHGIALQQTDGPLPAPAARVRANGSNAGGEIPGD